jgi:hypothetical protein
MLKLGTQPLLASVPAYSGGEAGHTPECEFRVAGAVHNVKCGEREERKSFNQRGSLQSLLAPD